MISAVISAVSSCQSACMRFNIGGSVSRDAPGLVSLVHLSHRLWSRKASVPWERCLSRVGKSMLRLQMVKPSITLANQKGACRLLFPSEYGTCTVPYPRLITVESRLSQTPSTAFENLSWLWDNPPLKNSGPSKRKFSSTRRLAMGLVCLFCHS